MKTILITGGAQGIGKQIAKTFAKKNYNVIINYNNSKKEAEELKKELLKINKNIEIFKADISKRDDVKKLIKFAIKNMKNIDVLINNAGIAKLQMFQDVTEEDWNEIMDTNLKSVYYTIQEVMPNMIHQKAGCIINISSMWGMVGAACEAVYSASKAGIDAITKSLAKELGPSNIRVNSIAPGVINTEMNSILDEKIKEELKKDTPLERIGEPIDVYRCAKWLVEDEFTTGQVISVNGGYVI